MQNGIYDSTIYQFTYKISDTDDYGTFTNGIFMRCQFYVAALYSVLNCFDLILSFVDVFHLFQEA